MGKFCLFVGKNRYYPRKISFKMTDNPKLTQTSLALLCQLFLQVPNWFFKDFYILLNYNIKKLLACLLLSIMCADI